MDSFLGELNIPQDLFLHEFAFGRLNLHWAAYRLWTFLHFRHDFQCSAQRLFSVNHFLVHRRVAGKRRKMREDIKLTLRVEQ